jgi:hypothetical protein
MGGGPYLVFPFIPATPSVPVSFQNSVTRFNVPAVVTPAGQLIYPPGRSTRNVPANTEIDIQHFENEMAAATPGAQINPLAIVGIAQDFENGYIATYVACIETAVGGLKFNADYLGTAGIKLASLFYPNGYGGASPGFAPFTSFDASGRVIGDFGPESLMTNRSHSTFHSLQAGLAKTSTRAGLGFQVNYTFSKSLDDVSSPAVGAFPDFSGFLLQTPPRIRWTPERTKARQHLTSHMR